ncbi:MAG: DUF2460 domain-containing protein [Tissierellia bacterium]|nr:DUF2460 domain-containing protein [Tissierellia bacterium]
MLKQQQYKAQEYKTYEVKNPGGGGLNIEDLPFNLLTVQSPKMLNMMMKNGTFSKRYGQSEVKEFDDPIITVGYYMQKMIVHAGTKLYSYEVATDTLTELYSSMTTDKGIFINFNKNLYYLNGKYIQYDNTDVKEVVPYEPDLCINRKPDGTYSDLVDNYNRLGSGFKNTFNGDGSSKKYVLTDKELDATLVKVTVGTTDMTENSGFTVDREKGEVTFTTAPATGQNNVVITAYKTTQKYIDSILNCKYHVSFGGENNSRLFLAGSGNAVYYYSDVFDASYFPENNYGTLGNGEYDITGFGEQYNVLVVFKESEMYAISYYYDSDSMARFDSRVINAHMGCDIPGSIKLVDNKLTWAHTRFGVLVLQSTVIEDERNVNVISRNVNGGVRNKGLLQENNLKDAQTVVFQGKYFFTVNNHAYVWDYLSTPYVGNKDPDQDALVLAWYYWDNIDCNSFIHDELTLYYASGNKICKFNNSYDDFGEAITSYYQTPFFQFTGSEWLKTIKKMYVMVRGDTPSQIKIKYITEENPQGEKEVDDINVYTKLWDEFKWNTFGWTYIEFGNTFARNCSIKKVQMLSILFENNQPERDMSIVNMKFLYTPVKRIK